jgi:hypothetical protein
MAGVMLLKMHKELQILSGKYQHEDDMYINFGNFFVTWEGLREFISHNGILWCI